MIRVFFGSATSVGSREVNEDSLLVVASQDTTSGGVNSNDSGAAALMIIADGMGGRAKGKLASRTAIKAIYRDMAHILAVRADADQNYVESNLQNSMKAANTRLRDVARERPGSDGMGTTATVAVVMKGQVSVGHVGDSRAYLFRPSERLHQITNDHSVVGDEIRSGNMSEEQAKKSKFRNVITRAIGVEEDVTADIETMPVLPGDTLILCSDGLHGVVSDSLIERIVRDQIDPQSAADHLVALALENQGKDNISVIVVKLVASDAPLPQSSSRIGHATESTETSNSKQLANVGSFLLGAILVGVMLSIVRPSFVSRPATLHHATSSIPIAGSPLDLSSVTYGAPEQLLGRSVLPSVLLRADSNLIVVDPQQNQELTVAPDGNIVTIDPDSSKLSSTPASTTYWASDSVGNLYESQPDPPAVRKFDSKGNFLRTIGEGAVKAPGAIAVEPNGDVFVIESGTLTRFPALPATSPTPTNPAPISET